MSVGVVIPVGPGREENLTAVLACLAAQGKEIPTVVVRDGNLPDDSWPFCEVDGFMCSLSTPKHRPGMEQPRNLGVRELHVLWPEVTHCWFLDSDVMVGPGCLKALELAIAAGDQDRIVVAPYDWLECGLRPTPGRDFPAMHNDPRWPMFDNDPSVEFVNDLSAGLACFSGNLVWPVDRFIEVGGFWSELHHGRCEDGELGLRAVAMDVPISFAGEARGWHLWHPINMGLAMERNARDVPMLNARHPWVQGSDVFLVDRDGKAFDVACGCGQSVPTGGWWTHATACEHTTVAIKKQQMCVYCGLPSGDHDEHEECVAEALEAAGG